MYLLHKPNDRILGASEKKRMVIRSSLGRSRRGGMGMLVGVLGSSDDTCSVCCSTTLMGFSVGVVEESSLVVVVVGEGGREIPWGNGCGERLCCCVCSLFVGVSEDMMCSMGHSVVLWFFCKLLGDLVVVFETSEHCYQEVKCPKLDPAQSVR